MTNQQFMTIREVAEYLRVDRSTVWRWCVEGKLAAFQIGRSWRIHRTIVEQLVEPGLPAETLSLKESGEQA